MNDMINFDKVQNISSRCGVHEILHQNDCN